MEIKHVTSLLHEYLHIAHNDRVDVLGGETKEGADVIQTREEVKGDVNPPGAGNARRFPQPFLPPGRVGHKVGHVRPTLEQVYLNIAQCELGTVGNLLGTTNSREFISSKC